MSDVPMSGAEAAQAMREGLELLGNNSRVIAMLPLEQWLDALNRAETLGPIMDATLYREYLFSGRGEVIKDLLRAALVLKRAVLKMQPAIREIDAREAK